MMKRIGKKYRDKINWYSMFVDMSINDRWKMWFSFWENPCLFMSWQRLIFAARRCHFFCSDRKNFIGLKNGDLYHVSLMSSRAEEEHRGVYFEIDWKMDSFKTKNWLHCVLFLHRSVKSKLFSLSLNALLVNLIDRHVVFNHKQHCDYQ